MNEELKEVILKFPEQFKESISLAQDVKVEGNFDKILVCGMGGSAFAGYLLKSYRQDLLVLSRLSYGLPQWVNEKTLVAAISYSGNTEETLSCYERALKGRNALLAITSGGKLEKRALEEKTALVKIPSGIQPRLAVGYMFGTLLMVLSNSGIIEDQRDVLVELSRRLEPAALRPRAQEIAARIGNKIPLIYSSLRNQVLSYAWKIRFNENLKTFAFCNVWPESHHNDISSFLDKITIPCFI